MKRRDYIKTITLGAMMPFTATADTFDKFEEFFKPAKVHFKSSWSNWPDMKWAGPEYWGNCLQDWRIRDGKLLCDYTGSFRTLHLLTVQNKEGDAPLEVSVKINKVSDHLEEFNSGCVGMLLGAKGPFEDYRSAAVFGKGLKVGLNPEGKLIIGNDVFDTGFSGLPESFILKFSSTPKLAKNKITVRILDVNKNELFEKSDIVIDKTQLAGNVALIADFKNAEKKEREEASVSFENWQISSDSLHENKENLFGPICFAQYSLHQNKLKLTAQFAPIEEIEDHKVQLQFKINGKWDTYEETQVTHEGRAVNFQIPDWKFHETPYRLKAVIPVGGQWHEYIYGGTIAKEPKLKDELKVAVFSCNAHYGFPDGDIYDAMKKLEPDLSVFLGDQFYESTGGYGVLFRGDFDKQCLDYLRKWMMFGWSYREIYRNIPCAIIPDDHDVFHGNIWGESGKQADTSNGFGASAQDSGGFKMPPEWVNMVQFTQTSHLPDAYDSAPVKTNIGVYYTNWNYAGVSFAILEDRKFKSAPKHVLPKEAEVYNGWIYNSEFDIKKHAELDANLLGERQEKFLNEWVEDWSEDIQMKAVLSQTNFCNVATLPEGSKDGSVIPKLKIPEKGEYIKGDRETVDMDSNGWPKNKRDKAVTIIRKALAFHITGDNHLGSFIQYGVNDHQDGSFAFAGPALNNLWPRRFWPPVDHSSHTYEKPSYTGNFEDGFGNFFTLHAVANPYNRRKKPEVLYNRANGYGLVIFNKQNRTIKTSCYERFKDPIAEDAQYPGWPITINQEDNFLKNAKHYLPHLMLKGEMEQLPILKVYNMNRNLVYAVRMPNKRFQPKVHKQEKYYLELINTKNNRKQNLGAFQSKKENNLENIEIELI